MDRRSAAAAGFVDEGLAARLPAEAFLDAVLATTHEAIICADAQGRILSWNAGAERVFGYRSEEILGQPVMRLVPTDLQPEAQGLLLRVAREGRVAPLRTRRRRRDGTEITVELSLALARPPPHEMVVSMVRDLSDAERAEALLAELQQAQRIARVGSWQWDVRTDRTFYSPETLRMYGLPPETSGSYQSFLESILPEDRAGVAAAVDEALEKSQPCSFEFRLRRRPQDPVRWVHTELRVETDAQGRVIRLYGTDQDITEKKEAEEALRRSEERFRLIAKATSDAFFEWDMATDEVWWGGSAPFGYDPADFPHGQAYIDRIHPEDRPRIMERVQQALQNGGDSWQDPFDYRLRRKDGSYAYVHGRASLVRDGAGRPVRIVGGLTDTTERVMAQRQLATEARRLTRSNEELERFAYVISHDLQEPLRTVASYVQLLARRYAREDANAREYTAYVTEGVARMRCMIEALLAYARISHETLAAGEANLERVLGAVKVSLGTAITESGAVVSHDPLPTLRADPVLMEQVLQNLVANAIKFRSAEAPRIHVSAERRGEEWLITVRDNGIGIEPRFAEKVFVLFQRLNTREAFPGSGIGLAICKKIIEAHGGRIWVEPAAIGSRFCFSLPATPPG